MVMHALVRAPAAVGRSATQPADVCGRGRGCSQWTRTWRQPVFSSGQFCSESVLKFIYLVLNVQNVVTNIILCHQTIKQTDTDINNKCSWGRIHGIWASILPHLGRNWLPKNRIDGSATFNTGLRGCHFQSLIQISWPACREEIWKWNGLFVPIFGHECRAQGFRQTILFKLWNLETALPCIKQKRRPATT